MTRSSNDKDRSLRRMKGAALAALLAAVGLLLLSQHFGRQGWWGWLGAFAEAATVGALADWFAVTALFRHPLGLPIPHTAIILRNRERLTNALAQFVGDKFLDREVLLQRMAGLNAAQKIGNFLATPAQLHHLTEQLQEWAATTVGALDNPELERELTGFVRQQLRQWNVAPAAAQLAQVLAQDGQHQHLLNAALNKVADWVGTPAVRALIAEKMVATARQEYPKIVWMTDKLDYTDNIAEALAKRLAQALVDELQVILADPQHPLRQHYAAAVTQWLQRLQNDPDMQQKLQQIKDQLLNHPSLQESMRQFWQQGCQWIQRDLHSGGQSVIATCFRRYAAALGERLQHNPGWQNALNSQLQVLVWHLAGYLRQIAPEHIRATMRAWDDANLVNEIERHVGRDLQFIRLNGTVIGGLVGVLLYALTK